MVARLTTWYLRLLRMQRRRPTSTSCSVPSGICRCSVYSMVCLEFMIVSSLRSEGMLSKGGRPYTIWYRMHPNDHTSDGLPACRCRCNVSDASCGRTARLAHLVHVVTTSSSHDSLRRHVVWRSNDLIARNVHGSDGDLLCNAKVDELQAIAYEQKVGGLEIRVNKISSFVDELNRFEHL